MKGVVLWGVHTGWNEARCAARRKDLCAHLLALDLGAAAAAAVAVGGARVAGSLAGHAGRGAGVAGLAGGALAASRAGGAAGGGAAGRGTHAVGTAAGGRCWASAALGAGITRRVSCITPLPISSRPSACMRQLAVALTSWRSRGCRRWVRCSTGQRRRRWSTRGWSTRARQSSPPYRWCIEWRWCRSRCKGVGRRLEGQPVSARGASCWQLCTPDGLFACPVTCTLVLPPPAPPFSHQLPVQSAQAPLVQYWLAPHCCRAGGRAAWGRRALSTCVPACQSLRLPAFRLTLLTASVRRMP